MTKKYSTLSNTIYALKEFWKYHKLMIFMCIVGTITALALPFLTILLPRVVIDALTANVTPSQFVSQVGIVAIAIAALNFIKTFAEKIIQGVSMNGYNMFSRSFVEKQITIDYELLENPEVQKIQSKASLSVNHPFLIMLNLPDRLADVAVNIFGLLLFGGVVAVVSPVILLLLVVSITVNAAMLTWARKYEERKRDAMSDANGQRWYIMNTLRNPSYAKDIRLYSLSGFLKDMLNRVNAAEVKHHKDVENRNMATRLIDAVLLLARDGAAYAFLIYMVLDGRIGLGEFVFIFAAVGTIAGWATGIVTTGNAFLETSSKIGDLRDFLDCPNRMNTGAGCPLPPLDKPPGITLTNVSYTYPGAEKPALRDVNLTIAPGERIAIVGANGAGKTTLIKMLCGLYTPTTGEIQLDGKAVPEYNRDEYYSLFSTVFQDIHLTTTGIIGNVSSLPPEDTCREKLNQTLRLAGLHDKVSSLPLKENTGIVRRTDETAIELSGGEKQKLALARALYKDAPVIILDEPTAALDPIAENEVYQKYAELTHGKTSLYISHRLASTRFCDRILFIENNTIAEVGAHDQLMAKAGGYAHMFNIQASYYNEEGIAI